MFHPSGSTNFQIKPFNPTKTAIEHQPAIRLTGIKTPHLSKTLSVLRPRQSFVMPITRHAMVGMKTKDAKTSTMASDVKAVTNPQEATPQRPAAIHQPLLW